MGHIDDANGMTDRRCDPKLVEVIRHVLRKDRPLDPVAFTTVRIGVPGSFWTLAGRYLRFNRDQLMVRAMVWIDEGPRSTFTHPPAPHISTARDVHIDMRRTTSAVLDWHPSIAETIRELNNASDFFLALGLEDRTRSERRLQELGYREARKRWPTLRSSLVRGARDCAADMLEPEMLRRLPRKSEHGAARFNNRTFKAHLGIGSFSLATVGGRLKVPLRIARHFDEYRAGEVVALRVRNDRGMRRVDLMVELPEAPVRDAPGPKAVGADRGILNTAVLGTGGFFNPRRAREIQGRYVHNHRCLRSAGTRSAKRHPCRMRGREGRFQADVNRCIAKAIVASDFDVMAIEDLHFERTEDVGRRFDRLLGRRASARLESSLRYKAEEPGERVVPVPPEHTGRMCSRCGDLGDRKRHGSHSPVRGSRLDADRNGARDIAHLGSALVGRPIVNGPIVAGRYAEHGTSVESSHRPAISMGGGR